LIEIIKDEDEVPLVRAQAPNMQPPSLLQRLGGALPLSIGVPPPLPPPLQTEPATAKGGAGMTNIAARKQRQAAQRVQGLAAKPVAVAPRQKARAKKGPKRLKKTMEQLDREMDDYRAHTDDPAAMKDS